jgi:hypothetical protein
VVTCTLSCKRRAVWESEGLSKAPKSWTDDAKELVETMETPGADMVSLSLQKANQ